MAALQTSDEASRVVEQVERGGSIDVLVNNAGYGHEGSVEESSMVELRHQLKSNVFGAVALIKGMLPYMRQRRSGRHCQHHLDGWPEDLWCVPIEASRTPIRYLIRFVRRDRNTSAKTDWHLMPRRASGKAFHGRRTFDSLPGPQSALPLGAHLPAGDSAFRVRALAAVLRLPRGSQVIICEARRALWSRTMRHSQV